MQKFSHGDKVTCTIDGTKITDSKISIDKDGTQYICQNEVSGANEAEETFGYKYSWALCKDFTSFYVADLKLVEEQEMETVTEKIYGWWNTDTRNLQLSSTGNIPFVKTYKQAYEDKVEEQDVIELTISYQIPKVKTITKEEAEKLLGYKIV